MGLNLETMAKGFGTKIMPNRMISNDNLAFVFIGSFLQEKQYVNDCVRRCLSSHKGIYPSLELIEKFDKIAVKLYEKHIIYGNALIMLHLDKTEGCAYIFPINNRDEIVNFHNSVTVDDIFDFQITSESSKVEIVGWGKLAAG